MTNVCIKCLGVEGLTSVRVTFVYKVSNLKKYFEQRRNDALSHIKSIQELQKSLYSLI